MQLPKKMIYSRCNEDDTEINHYLHLFMMGHSVFKGGEFYTLYVSPTQ